MMSAASDPRFQEAVSVPPIRPGLLGDIARVGIALYWQEANFTVLHMVTATHAARVLFGRFPALATDGALQALWGAICAAYASVGAPILTERLATPNLLSWDKISAQAVGNNDDHVIKMTYTCRCEAKQCGNPLYQASAARLVAVGKA
jgi:Questin oxidase-like